MERAIKLLQHQEFSLTSVHSDLCKLALESKTFSPAIRIINEIDLVNSITFDDFNEFYINIKFLLLYFYYAGLILTAIKVPTTKMDEIILILISLLILGVFKST